MTIAKDFNEVMRTPEPPPAPLPDIGTGPDAAKAWQDAISGRQKPLGLADTQAAARSWLNQPFDGVRMK